MASTHDTDAQEPPHDPSWRAAALFGSLRHDLWALDRSDAAGLAELIDEVVGGGPAAVRRCPDLILALRAFMDRTWARDEVSFVSFVAPAQHDVLHAPLLRFDEVPALVRATLRRADHDYPDDRSLPIRLRLNCGNAAFPQFIEQLRARPGFVGLFAGRDGQSTTNAKVFASARAEWLIERRPLQLEIATYTTDDTGDDETARSRVAALLGRSGTESLLVGGLHDIFPRGASTAPSAGKTPARALVQTTATRLFGSERCAHPAANWEKTVGGDTWRLSCRSCLRSAVAVVPRHRLPDDLIQPDDEEARGYLARYRIQARLRGEDVPGLDFAGLREHDGQMSLDNAAYAISPRLRPPSTGRPQDIGEALARRRARSAR